MVAPLERVKIIYQVTNAPFSLIKFPRVLVDIVEKEGVRALWRGHTASLLRVVPYAGIQFMTYDFLKRRFIEQFKNREDQALRVSETMLCGGTAGAVGTAATYPLDLARSRMAVTPPTHASSLIRFHVMRSLHSWHKIGGVAELYKGLLPTLLGVIPYGAISFSTNEAVKRVILRRQNCGQGGAEKGELKVWHKLLAGGVAGIVAQTSTYPLEIMRRRMQTAGHVHADASIESTYTTDKSANRVVPGSAKHHAAPPAIECAAAAAARGMSMSATIAHLYDSHGWRGFFKGVSLNWIKGPIAVSISFTTFDFFKSRLEKYHIS